jgi:hypothetical protein
VSGGGVPRAWLPENVEQQPSHTKLSQDVSLCPAPPRTSLRSRLDAVIVPAARLAECLQPVIDLAASLDVVLVVLCSKRTNVEDAARRVSRTPGARSLVIEVAEKWNHPGILSRTSAQAFQNASGNRGSCLSGKRNLGLLLARLQGWNKIAFVDDDITISRLDHVARLAAQLEEHQVAGMRVLHFPDNSVVCHARRLAGLVQDVFVTGAVLGVHCNDLPLSFFPDIYNEDWFFFAEEAAARRLPCAGDASQTRYDPFESPKRARHEEFGDLLAEGLYALVSGNVSGTAFDDQLRHATTAYWSRFIDARRQLLNETMALLYDCLDTDSDNRRKRTALTSLAAAQSQLDIITADICADFLDAWRTDLRDWQRFSNGVNSVRSTGDAMDFLQLNTWTEVRCGGLR